jgi:lysophospholipase L1-like esterase
MPADVRICFFGDSFVNGTHDETYLGWMGRVCTRLRTAGQDLTAYNLGIRRDTSRDILGRWRGEAERRLPGHVDGRLVFSFGTNDGVWEQGAARVPLDETLENAVRILAPASAWKPTLVIGPAPIALQGQGDIDARIRNISTGIDIICCQHRIPFLDLHRLLVKDQGWFADMASGDGVHPASAGYARLAAIIEGWDQWTGWFTSTAPMPSAAPPP